MSAEEAVVDAVETTIEAVEKATPGRHFNLNGTTRGQQIGILVGAVVLGAVAGGGGTYILLKKKLELKYEKIAQQEIEATREHYHTLQVAREKPASPEDLVAQLHGENELDESETAKEGLEALRSYQGEAAESVEVVEEEVEVQATETRNIFDNKEPVSDDEDEWDYDEELRLRDEHAGRPYIISHDEFFEGEKDYEQTSLTYFEGDDVLSDDRDTPVQDTDGTVGDDNLTRFGHGSKDENTVYVRNDKLELDFEIVRSPGKFQVEVLGFDDVEEDSLRHSHGRGIRKFRRHDE